MNFDNAIAICGFDGAIRYASEGLAQIAGYSQSELIGLNFRQFCTLSNRRKLVHQWAQITQVGSIGGEVQFMLRTAESDRIPMSMEVTPIPGRDEFLVVYRNAVRRRDQLAALTRIFTALSGSLSLSQVLDLVLDQVVQVIPSEHCGIFLLRGQKLQRVRSRGLRADAELPPTPDWLIHENLRRVFETRRFLIINDCHNSPYWRVTETSSYVRSWMGIPLVYKGRFCGVLELISKHPDAFTLVDASIGQIFGQQAAAAIRHAQLYRAVRTRARRLRTLNDIATTVSHLEEGDAIKAIAYKIAPLLEADIFYVALYDAETQTMHMLHRLEGGIWTERGHNWPADGLAGYVVRTRQTLVMGDEERDTYPAKVYNSLRTPNSRNLVMAPLVARDEAIGVICVQSYHPDFFSAEAINLLETIAAHTATAIRNAQLFAETNERLATLASLQQTSSRLAERIDEPLIHELVARETRRLLNPDQIRIYSRSQPTHQLTPQLAFDADWQSLLSTSDATAERMAQQVTGSGLPIVVVESAEADSAQVAFRETWVAHPIRRGAFMYGVITLHFKRAFVLRKHEEHTLSLLLSQAAGALENARYSAEVSSRLAEVSALYQVSRQVAGRLELDAILQDVAASLRGIFPCRACLIVLPDDDDDVLHIRATAGLSPEMFSALQFNMNGGVIQQVVAEGHSIHVPDVGAHGQNLGYDDGARSLLAVPLIAHEIVLGALAIDSTVAGAFTSEHERTLEIAASQIAAAIDNARLYQEARERAQRLADANRDLEALNRLRDELVQNLSHELRTPLAFVKGYVGLLKAGDLGTITDEQHDALDIIDRKSETIARLIADIMMLETLSADHLLLTQVDLRQLVIQAVDGAHLTHRETSIAFVAEVPEQPIFMMGDADRLNQVLDNLIGNAVKFSPQGGCIRVSAGQDSTGWRLGVSDEGIGISPDKLAQIFDRFYQIEGGMRRRFGGAGLGLAIVRRIVEAHGGSIQVESQPSKGSLFLVTFPLAEPLYLPEVLRIDES